MAPPANGGPEDEGVSSGICWKADGFGVDSPEPQYGEASACGNGGDCQPSCSAACDIMKDGWMASPFVTAVGRKPVEYDLLPAPASWLGSSSGAGREMMAGSSSGGLWADSVASWRGVSAPLGEDVEEEDSGADPPALRFAVPWSTGKKVQSFLRRMQLAHRPAESSGDAGRQRIFLLLQWPACEQAKGDRQRPTRARNRKGKRTYCKQHWCADSPACFDACRWTAKAFRPRFPKSCPECAAWKPDDDHFALDGGDAFLITLRLGFCPRDQRRSNGWLGRLRWQGPGGVRGAAATYAFYHDLGAVGKKETRGCSDMSLGGPLDWEFLLNSRLAGDSLGLGYPHHAIHLSRTRWHRGEK